MRGVYKKPGVVVQVAIIKSGEKVWTGKSAQASIHLGTKPCREVIVWQSERGCDC